MPHLLARPVQSEIDTGGKVEDDDLAAEITPDYVVTNFNAHQLAPTTDTHARAKLRLSLPDVLDASKAGSGKRCWSGDRARWGRCQGTLEGARIWAKEPRQAAAAELGRASGKANPGGGLSRRQARVLLLT